LTKNKNTLHAHISGSVTVLRSTVCHTSADKLQILNLRDKIIRLGKYKNSEGY